MESLRREVEPLVTDSCLASPTHRADIDVEAEGNCSQSYLTQQSRKRGHMVALRLALLLALVVVIVGCIYLRNSIAPHHRDFNSSASLMAKFSWQPAASCAADILIESPDGAVRVSASAYKNSSIPLLTQFHRTHDGQVCSVADLVVCDQGHATLRTMNYCDQSAETHDEKMKKEFAIVREDGSNKGITFKPYLLPDMTSGTAKLTATFETCDIVDDQCKPGCCPEGFRCVFNEPSNTAGRCLAMDWKPEHVCINAVDPACVQLVSDFMATVQYWELIITSGGGGGHLAAAKNMAIKFGKAWHGMLATQEQKLKAGLALLTGFGRDALAETLAGAKAFHKPIQVVDIMNSPCTNLFGEMGLAMGHGMQATWDNAQKAGNIGYLKMLAGGQPLTDALFGRQCLNFMRDVLGNVAPHVAPHHGVPDKVIATEPLMLPSITEAIEEVMKNGKSLSKVHLYMTDLPGVGKYQAMNFWVPIRRMARLHPERTRRLIIHSLPPITGGAAALAEAAGGEDGHIETSQVVIEPFMPVTAQFLPPYGSTMPRPGQETQIPLKAQVPEEHAFLGGDSKNFAIAEGDELTLVMLGSQPTVSAIHKYFDQAKLLNLPADVSKTRWVFFACGPHQKEAFRELYASIAKKAIAWNSKASNARLRMIPFTGQPAQIMEGRAEVTVTRSGGMTAGELLALASRGDKKQVFLHIETTAEVPRMPMMPHLEMDGHIPQPPAKEDIENRKQWEDKALESGMVVWEAGNARYLMAKLGAELITPETFAQMANSPQEVALVASV
mmetsp:Transcript_23481/g.37569  ORF Transcript_23481/g.37569 Transcript_23481/m.37569 type:complete len:783 (+) Transcript_23481:41-2389(+)|eukprot:CAMPEP_0169078092 /NCGR_PEP_ID=MMETSP1015-20121227/9231_1 /TAXON_ID=342587 /ORGANISM="Karlodinium micrum, Strain CCMP2283" /LENGTH=782 /DNA_ID=CAMNT_0009137667 /DNA_START=39 /DNA_END=2387 /DNA_ORIENTATION=+